MCFLQLRAVGVLIALVIVGSTAWSQTPPAAAPSLEAMEEAAIRAAIDRVAPSVVRIETLGGLQRVSGRLTSSAPTTGVIVSADGYILSSTFNFAAKPSSILVTLPSGKRVAAHIVARDRSRQLILLKVDPPQPLPVPEWIHRSDVRVGQWAIAVGRTYTGPHPNISVGIISAVNRIWGKAVQTDAKISPSNYGGPLIDIQGRVIGILAALSPQASGEFAGAEWYDSGIGFAVPLAEVMQRLGTLKAGEDLQPGLLGVSLKGTDIYSLPATIAACPAKSPARKAGLKVGDTIVAIDQTPIATQAQLRHALGPHYAGDQIKVRVQRGEDKKTIEATIELVAQVDPYVQPRLGILPQRQAITDRAGGVKIRYVFPDSPAAKAGLQAGDTITQVDAEAITGAAQLVEYFAGLDPGQLTKLTVQRDGKPRQLQATLDGTFRTAGGDLTAAYKPPAGGPPVQVPTGVVKVEIPEHSNSCFAFVPENYSPTTPCGLMVWLHGPGEWNQEELLSRWRAHCKSAGLILLVPQSKEKRGWSATEVEFIRKSIDDIMQDYVVDRSRVVVHGYRTGGAMAYLVALGHRDLIRGVAPVAAGLPGRVTAPTTDPAQPLAIYSVSSSDAPSRKLVEASEAALRKLAFPVVAKELPGPERYLQADELQELLRWADTLDQI